MSTIKEVLDRVDARKPNAFTSEQKAAWLSELEGMIALNVFLMDISEAEQFRYAYPDDQCTKLLVRFPHDCVYELWLEAKIDMANGEYDKYQNAMIQYNEAYSNFVKWFARVYAPAQGCGGANPQPCPDVPVYYITAYGLAVMQGFSGTLDEWLASLKGEKGDYAVPIDKSLTKAGEAADAEVVGTEFDNVKKAIDNLASLDTTLKTAGKAADAAAVGAALEGKAPAGYGLGAAEGKSWKDVDSIIQPGWYAFYDSVVVADYTFGAAGMRVDALDANSVIQTIHSHYTPMVELKRHCIAGTWYDWEWVNPLMHLNREYRTTRRWNGKPEYTMLLDLGQAPVDKSISITHGIADVQEINGEFLWSANGETTKGNTYFVNGAVGAYTWTTADSVGIRSVSVDTTGVNVSVVLRYTKTTG